MLHCYNRKAGMKRNYLRTLLCILQMTTFWSLSAGRLVEYKKYREIRRKLSYFLKNYRNSTSTIAKAAEAGRYDVVQDFLQYSVSWNKKNDAVIQAARSGHLSIVRLLIDHGADLSCYSGQPLIEALNGENKATYEFILNSIDNLESYLGGRGNYAFRVACKIGDLQVAQRIQKLPEVDINDLQGFTLRLAFLYNEIAGVRYLLQYGARVDFFDKKWILRFLPLFIGMEDQLKKNTQKSSKEQKKVLQSAIVEYCLRARLLEK